eukprot:Amastigsp_a6884_21.p4 type:complete len:112 gc:universal Amastigsp_a6884_21:481-146(-)
MSSGLFMWLFRSLCRRCCITRIRKEVGFFSLRWWLRGTWTTGGCLWARRRFRGRKRGWRPRSRRKSRSRALWAGQFSVGSQFGAPRRSLPLGPSTCFLCFRMASARSLQQR